ncbi:MAG: hypothetical protein ACRDAM_17500 [Casimicrobium sp.]
MPDVSALGVAVAGVVGALVEVVGVFVGGVVDAVVLGIAVAAVFATLATAAFCASTPSVRKLLKCGPANTTAGV